MSILKNISIFSLLIILLFSCKKDAEEQVQGPTEIDKELIDHYIFNPGSYWVYQDMFNNIDSIFLDEKIVGVTDPCSNDTCERYNYTKLLFSNSRQDSSFNYYYKESFIRLNGGGVWGQNGQPIYEVDSYLFIGYEGLMLTSRIEQMEVSGITYHDILVYSVKVDYQAADEFKYDTDMYFAPDIGLIRKITYDPNLGVQFWDLISYHLEELVSINN